MSNTAFLLVFYYCIKRGTSDRPRWRLIRCCRQQVSHIEFVIVPSDFGGARNLVNRSCLSVDVELEFEQENSQCGSDQRTLSRIISGIGSMKDRKQRKTATSTTRKADGRMTRETKQISSEGI